MPETSVHISDSLEHIACSYPFFEAEKETITRLITELHEWLDEYHNTKTEDYDYTGINVMKHREKRHHLEGIIEAKELFSAKYGEKYAKIIQTEAGRHVSMDMKAIYSASDYRQIGFWKRIRGF